MTDRIPDDEWLEAANCLATVAHQLSSAAHEANNLLQVIAGSAEMIQLNPALPEKVLQRATTIAEHAHRVSTLLGSVRELAKFAPPRTADQTNLVAIVSAALDVRRHALTRGRVSVSTGYDEPPPVARISWRPAMQLILNLLLNAEYAVRARESGTIDIQVRRDAETVVVTVRDNGSGLPRPAPERFALRTMPDGPPLLGIGLVAAQRIAGRERGTLEISAGEEGTIARLTLPGV
jgi:C4-dicarboxylate-specific signal transduction histidine kinase